MNILTLREIDIRGSAACHFSTAKFARHGLNLTVPWRLFAFP